MANKNKSTSSVKKSDAGRKTAKAPARRKAAKKAARKAAVKKTPKAAPKSAAKATKKGPRKVAGKAPGKGVKKASKKAPRKTARVRGKKAKKKTARGVRGAVFFEHFRRKLVAEREQILDRLDELREELRGLQRTPREIEEWAQEEKDRDILIRLEDRDNDELRRIQAALGLIDQRGYGQCQLCRKPIPRARLEELPTAFRCVSCTT